MESFRIDKRDIYVIEVNDAGETIEFDLLDIELPYKLDRAFRKINEVQNRLKGALVIIDKKTDRKIKNSVMTEKEEAILAAYKEAFKGMREAFDSFAGQGASQKIFGDRNYLEMFSDLFEVLKPHLDKMKLNSDGISERIAKKYGSSDGNTLK